VDKNCEYSAPGRSLTTGRFSSIILELFTPILLLIDGTTTARGGGVLRSTLESEDDIFVCVVSAGDGVVAIGGGSVTNFTGGVTNEDEVSIGGHVKDDVDGPLVVVCELPLVFGVLPIAAVSAGVVVGAVVGVNSGNGPAHVTVGFGVLLPKRKAMNKQQSKKENRVYPQEVHRRERMELAIKQLAQLH
jgi:hypothetical protein